MKRILVTGSSGLIGSDCALYFSKMGWEVFGIDNNMRMDFFGPDGDTRWNLRRVKASVVGFRHLDIDVRNRTEVGNCVESIIPNLLVHCAAQPSHDLAAKRPFDDFDINAVGTMNLLEATRLHAQDAVFCFLSTNKVYGDAPNELPLKELETRWEFANAKDHAGIDENMRMDQSNHSLFGAGKAAADLMVQEYGRYFGIKTCCFRGGCLTGPAHSAAELHGFIAYLVKCVVTGRKYTIYGYKGKQVRDNLHSLDVCSAIESFYLNPRPGEVYNLGGGRGNSLSVLEAIDMAERMTGKRLAYEYIDQPRKGDHICYITNLGKMLAHHPGWSVTRSLEAIVGEIIESLRGRV